MKTIAKTLLLALIVFCFAASASAATFVVNTGDDTVDTALGNGTCADSNSNCSLRAAISEANALAGADTIMLPAGIYTQTLTTASTEDTNTGGDWDILGDLTIIGAGRDVTILQAAPTPDTATEGVIESPLVSNPPAVVITGVTIRHGKKTGTDQSKKGGGIRNFGGDMTINDSTVTLNRGANGGGIYNRGNITLNNVIVSGNTCDQQITTCFGGGMYNTPSAASVKNITINGSTFTGNTAVGSGSVAQVYAAGFGAESSIDNGMVINISNSSFTDNHGSAFNTNPEISGGNGSGIRISVQAPSILNITNTVVSGNSIAGGGGMIRGTGIAISTTANLTGTWDKLTVANNTTGNFFGNGIAITASGTPAVTFDIVNSTISGNTGTGSANIGGGVGILAHPNSQAAVVTMNFLNSTISGNTSGGSGGGVYLDNAGSSAVFTANFNFCTIAGNSAAAKVGSGGGLAQVGGSTHINVKNSIVADNTAGSGPDIFGTITSQDYNHIENVSGGTFVPSANDTSGFDPQLDLLQNNGGPTLTHLPAFGSAVLNSIPNGQGGCGSIVTTDQRGFIRPAEGSCDKGSVEASYFAPGPWSVSGTITNSSGMPIRNAEVVITGGGLAQPVKVYTGNFGQYGFTGLTGAAYRVSVSAKRFRFQTSNVVVDLNNNAANVNFTANPQFEGKGSK